MQINLQYAIGGALFLLVGCATDDIAKGVEYTCIGTTITVQSATALNSQLTPEQRAHISNTVAVLNPTCSQFAPPLGMSPTWPLVRDNWNVAVAAWRAINP